MPPTMLLSDLMALPADQMPEEALGVVVDDPAVTPPPGLRRIGLMYRADDRGELDDDLLDVLISYELANIPTVLEVPADAPVPDPRYLMQVAANAGFSVSLLPPPAEATEADHLAYVERLVAFTTVYLSQQNFSRYIHPLSSFLEYMFAEEIGGVQSMVPSDPYLVARFLSVMTPDRVDHFKEAVRHEVYACHGGPDGFASFARAVLYKVYEQTRGMARELAALPPAAAGDAA